MLYCEKCHYVVLEEKEFRDVLFYLDCLSELYPEAYYRELEEYRDDFHDIIRSWVDGGVD